MGYRVDRPPRSSDKLPVLRNPAATKSNQRRDDAVGRPRELEWDDRHRRFGRRRGPKAQLAYVYLPPVFPFDGHSYEQHRRHYRATKPFGRQQRQDYDGSDDESNDASSDEGDGRVLPPLKTSTMRSQRMRSLAAMSKLQLDAATTIQREYRLYRRRQTDRNRRNQRLARQAQAFLDVFLLQEVTGLVPVCLLDVLRETRLQDAATTKHREDLAASLAEGVLTPLVDECIRDVFHDALQTMVKSYLAQRIDLSRAATPTAHAVAADILDDWTKELTTDVLPEVLAELASEYSARQQHEVVWEALLHDELQCVAAEAIAGDTGDAHTAAAPASSE